MQSHDWGSDSPSLPQRLVFLYFPNTLSLEVSRDSVPNHFVYSVESYLKSSSQLSHDLAEEHRPLNSRRDPEESNSCSFFSGGCWEDPKSI